MSRYSLNLSASRDGQASRRWSDQALYRRGKEELEQELKEQAEALRASNDSYDAGKSWEAKRLATTAYILLHSGGRNSRSLLDQLGLLGPMLSTADQSPSALMPLALITVDMVANGNGMTFAPRLDQHTVAPVMLPFKKWYKEPVFTHGHLRLTRKNLIFALRHQAGGAHVDETITDEAFQWLRTDSPIHIKTEPTQPARDAEGNEVETPPELANLFADYDGPVPNGHLASMRQIAWEIDQRLKSLGY